MAALVRLDADGYGQGETFTGLNNTAWSRVTICVKVNYIMSVVIHINLLIRENVWETRHL